MMITRDNNNDNDHHNNNNDNNSFVQPRREAVALLPKQVAARLPTPRLNVVLLWGQGVYGWGSCRAV